MGLMGEVGRMGCATPSGAPLGGENDGCEKLSTVVDTLSYK
jgi:hypothetical protein